MLFLELRGINMKKVFIAPSILSANFLHLEKEIKEVENAGAEYLHFDVMDGHFVNNISFGLPVLESIHASHSMINDVHIMISEPLKYAQRFFEAGADILTFHYEVASKEEDIMKLIDIAHKCKKKIGISIKPNTEVESIFPYIDKVDLILIMSVEPGFGGQLFNENCLPKIRVLREIIDKNNYKTLIEVDGGINKETAKLCKEAGVDILVAGSYVFKENKKERISSLR